MNNLLLIGSKDFIEKFTNIYSEKIQFYHVEKYIVHNKHSLNNINKETIKNYKKVIYLFPNISEDIYQLFDSIYSQVDISYFFNIESINLKFKNNLEFGIPHLSVNAIKKDNFIFTSLEKLLALIIVILISPILFIISILMIISDGFPIFFTQKRVGFNEKKFTIYKFRTLKTSTPKYMKSSERTRNYYTKIGLFLRRYNIDEMPQFFNVLNGSMSFIGPRPEMPFIVEEYNFVEKIRLQVKPGVSGSWQLSRAREREIHHNLEYDFNYIKNKNFLLDLTIFIQTAMRSFR